ncbi:unnamed protein product, partial [Vitis vinifera]
MAWEMVLECWEASRHIIACKYNLIQSVPHLPNAAWNAACKFVAGKHNNGGPRVAQSFRNIGCEPVMVHKQRIKILIEETTAGKGPTNRLLLTSSSWRIVSLEKLLGMIPQNRLELMWKRARSVIKPNSTGRYPAMSAWLRSTPATTLNFGLSSAGAQKTPLVSLIAIKV